MKNNVYIQDVEKYEYNNEKYFNPSTIYPEGLDISVKSDPILYDNMRKIFINMNLDSKNIGTKNWNPFKDFIKKDDKIVIKPNLVKHINQSLNGDTDSLITNFALIRVVIDYCLLALKGTGNVIVGDAPVQECVFEEVIKLNGLEEAIKIYNDNGYNVQLMDFRKNNNSDLECKLVSLNLDSSFIEVDKYWKKYGITNYNLKEMHAHHREGIHEYLIPKVVFDADVIINMPKPKTHRKAGITACMKNFVGINSKKEYLPHHRNGSINNNGDEYPEKSWVKFLKSNLKNYTYKNNFLINFFYKGSSFLVKKLNIDRFQEGSWYGNDTIWRTILDINKIILYANKNGNMTNKKQRTIFNIADMIISGEGEGPLLPSNKKVGLIVASFNQLNMDKVICQIMGFQSDKIKYIKNGYKLEKYSIAKNEKFLVYDQFGEVDVKKYNKKFIPTDGWVDYLLEGEKK